MACLGDAVGPLTLERPFRASGKIAMTRGVSDSTTLFGFYNSQDSMRRSESQDDAIPEAAVGIQIEGPSREGFFFYPVYRLRGGKGRISVSLDGRSAILDLDARARASGTRFDRFGIVTTWIDGNSQSVYWDDITYTVE